MEFRLGNTEEASNVAEDIERHLEQRANEVGTPLNVEVEVTVSEEVTVGDTVWIDDTEHQGDVVYEVDDDRFEVEDRVTGKHLVVNSDSLSPTV